MNPEKQELIAYRLSQAQEALQAAQALAELKSWKSCVNRLYYACFYAVSALFVVNDYDTSKHTGVRSLFNQHYVNTGLVSAKEGQTFNRMFQRRHAGDYQDFVRFNGPEVLDWVVDVEEFVVAIEQIVWSDN